MRLPVSRFLPLAAPIFLAGCMAGGGGRVPSAVLPTSGPAADYPVVIGEPFTIGDKTYTPEDTMNYDAVGYAEVGADSGPGVAASHKTLPLPSYVEVTDLDSGQTALVRVETRGPMRNDRLLELSPAAAKQLGITAGSTTPVRVRRVNPPEAERAMLRSGEEAPLRMDTPKALLTALTRKLDAEQPSGDRAHTPVIAAVDPDTNAHPAVTGQPKPAPKPAADAGSKQKPETRASTNPAPTAPPKPKDKQHANSVPNKKTAGRYVQVGAFSTQERARNAAAPFGAKVSKRGQYWLVRIGPLDSTDKVAAALEKARKAGYRDALVRSVD